MGFKTGMFKYFNELDEDCSGFLEPDEITGLALKFFGEHKQKACEEYVERVFREYDVDESGELSYEEAREFLKGIMAFLDSTGELSDEARAAFMEAMVEEEDSEDEEEVNDGDGNTDIGNGDITDNKTGDSTDNNNGEQVIEETISAKNESTMEKVNETSGSTGNSSAGKPVTETPKVSEPTVEKVSEKPKAGNQKPYKLPETKVMIDPIPTGPDGKPRLGRFGELLDENGIQILVNPGCIIGPDGKQLLLNKGEIRNPHDGEALVGKFGEILDVEANAIVQRFNNIQNPKGEAILGHLTRGTEETKLTSAGGLLDPNGQPILGPKPEPGCLLDINGKPIEPFLNKYGERIDTGDGGDNSGSKFTVGEGMGDTGYQASGASRPDFNFEWSAETNSQKSNLRKPVAKKWEIKKPDGHDGFCPLLRIYRPRTSMKKKDELANLPAKVRRFKWVRDPISDQWIHVERIGEEARAA